MTFSLIRSYCDSDARWYIRHRDDFGGTISFQRRKKVDTHYSGDEEEPAKAANFTVPHNGAYKGSTYTINGIKGSLNNCASNGAKRDWLIEHLPPPLIQNCPVIKKSNNYIRALKLGAGGFVLTALFTAAGVYFVIQNGFDPLRTSLFGASIVGMVVSGGSCIVIPCLRKRYLNKNDCSTNAIAGSIEATARYQMRKIFDSVFVQGEKQLKPLLPTTVRLKLGENYINLEQVRNFLNLLRGNTITDQIENLSGQETPSDVDFNDNEETKKRMTSGDRQEKLQRAQDKTAEMRNKYREKIEDRAKKRMSNTPPQVVVDGGKKKKK